MFDTNLRGTFTLLEAARAGRVARFVHVSTDEVYGSLEPPLEADEKYPLNPSSPYSASKAGSDLLALAYFKTFKLPLLVTRASNNYGPYQFPEKLIPLMISNALEDRPLPIYGDGMQVRDWLYVEDHCRAILTVLEKGRDGEIYNIGGNRSLAEHRGGRTNLGDHGQAAQPDAVRSGPPAHDRRYALSSEKLMSETGWQPLMDFESGLARTIDWYRAKPGMGAARKVRRVPEILYPQLRRGTLTVSEPVLVEPVSRCYTRIEEARDYKLRSRKNWRSVRPCWPGSGACRARSDSPRGISERAAHGVRDS